MSVPLLGMTNAAAGPFPSIIISPEMESTGEILKTGALADLTDLLKRLAGPSVDEVGAILADRVKLYRLENLLKIAEKTKRILNNAGVQPKSIPSRYLLPILDTCSVEDNDDLQERWAGLLASASQEGDSLSPSFIETLKQLTPVDAKHLDVICQESVKFHQKDKLHGGMELVLWAFGPHPHHGPKEFPVPPTVFSETYSRLGLIRPTHMVYSFYDRHAQQVESELDSWYEFTEYGVRFLNACRGPSPA